MRIQIALILLLPVLASAQVTKIADTIVDERALYLPDGQWGHTTNGRTFQQDAICTADGFQFTTYFDADRKLCVARRKLAEQNWDVIHFDDYRFKGQDTHNACVIGICPKDGTIHLSFDHHGSPLHYRVSQPHATTQPWSEKLFGATTDQPEPGNKIARVTYPRFIVRPDGWLQFQYRVGGSGNGESWIGDYIDGKWSNAAPFITGVGEFQSSKSRNAYENGYTYDARGRLHATWTWRESGDPMSNHDLLYSYSDDNALTWRNNAGDVIGRRGGKMIDVNSAGLKVFDIPMKRGVINSTTQAIDSHQRIHVVARHLPDEVPSQSDWNSTIPLCKYFHYWRDEKGDWHRNAMSFGGLRPQLCFDANDDAYLIFNDGTLKIAKATADQKWSDWRVIHSQETAFTDQPVINVHQNLLSVYIQAAPGDPRAGFSALHVIDFALPQRHKVPGTTSRATSAGDGH